MGRPRRRVTVAGVGLACIDVLAYGDIAKPGAAGWLRDLKLEGGGLVGTGLVAASRLGAQARWMGRVGDDWVSELILEGLLEEGIDVSATAKVSGGRSPASIILVDPITGERTIHHYPGANLDAARLDAISLDILNHAEVILLDDTWLQAAQLVAVRAHAVGIPVVSDIIPRETNQDLMPHIHALVVPHHCGEPLAERHGGYPGALAALRSLGAKTAVITLGERGCWYADDSEVGHVPAYKVRVVDTTGAGDVFHGAYAVALAEGCSIRECCKFASAAAALKCTEAGGRNGIPTREALVGFLEVNSPE